MQVGHCLYRAQRSSWVMSAGVGAGFGEEAEDEEDRSERRMARDDMDAEEAMSERDGSGGGGTGAWHCSRGHMQYVGSVDVSQTEVFGQKGEPAIRDVPISARRLFFRSCHRTAKSLPTTLSTRAAPISVISGVVSPVTSALSSTGPAGAAAVALRLTHAGLGHDTDSSVPSVIASVQHEDKQSWQLHSSERPKCVHHAKHHTHKTQSHGIWTHRFPFLLSKQMVQEKAVASKDE